jgi:hypothetical protein
MEEAEKKENEERDGVVAKARILEDESEKVESRRRGRVDPEDEEKDDF